MRSTWPTQPRRDALIPDVNVLVAAARSDHPHHDTAAAWLEPALRACATGATFRLPAFVAASFLRIVIHPKVFVKPMPMAAAIAFVDALLAVPGVEMPLVGAEWPHLRRLCHAAAPKSNDIPDIWLAAVVLDLNEHLVTFDKGLRKLLRRELITVL